MRNFKYLQPKTLDEASTLLAESGTGALPMGGGTDLLGILKEDIAAPEKVVNLKSVPGMREIQYSKSDGLTIGGQVTITEIAESDAIPEQYKILTEAANVIASPQLRNVGTLGGNLCQRPRCWYFRGDFDCLRKGGDVCYAVGGEDKYHCVIGGGPCFIVHPSDMAVALLALDARVEIFSAGSSKTIPLSEFFVLPNEDYTVENILEQGEIVTKVHVPTLPNNAKSHYIKIMERQVWDFAVVSIGAVVRGNSRKIDSGRIAFGGVAPVPWTEAELNNAIAGLSTDEVSLEKLKSVALKDAAPMDKNAYKVPLARNLVKRVLRELS
ncbi:MAG: xanthine dehydrogenase family protein subunit M [Candidatus Marinimicrobia bacterium]|nr:xanthine dehydrogenase family protein subunit M [Candidatus Neomarinimicrobiota bacterium]MCF7829538.1 xanthine dehydrogenase family protein subunit M [Candidatus Neomarinimicrobiota bacterium]MCF7880064.1 xanthine dehydrogenase family protein subunit M [Candidatus Neomarinimicrobiota bacterium]